MMDTVAELRAARRYITGVLLNLDINANETTVGTFLVMLDHFATHPEEYRELSDGRL